MNSLGSFGEEAKQQAAPRKVEVRMLVGLGASDTFPTVAGCVDGETLDIIGTEEADGIFAQMKYQYLELDPTMQWREVTVHLSAEKLLKHFSGPIIDGEVAE